MEIKGFCKDCHFAIPIGRFRYECPFRLGKSVEGYGIVKPTSYCDKFMTRKEETPNDSRRDQS